MIGEPRRCAIVAVGDELVTGGTHDTNSGRIAARLAELGIESEKFVVVGDDAPILTRVFSELCSAYAIVVATGGLGPTLDDVTREAAAAAARVPLVTDPDVLAGLHQRFASRGMEMPASNARQATFPAGAQIMPNTCGSAPGFRVWIDGGMLAVLPGPPREMAAMLEGDLVPWIERTCGRGPTIATAHFYLMGLAESRFADMVGEWMERSAEVLLGVTSHHGVLHATLRAKGADRAGTLALLEERARAFRQRFAAHVFSEVDARPAFAVGRALIEAGISLCTAESCTGGLVAELLTDVPGISAVFREGWVNYSNESKEQRLGVPAALLARHGAVSAEVAAAMASGAARASGARAALAITGVAGPGGGTPEKPVGLVWLGLALDDRVDTEELRLPPVDRESVRTYAAHAALHLLWRRLPRPAAH